MQRPGAILAAFPAQQQLSAVGGDVLDDPLVAIIGQRNRIDRGLATGLMPGIDPDATPACVVACTYGARLFGDLNDPDSPVSVALRNNPEAYRLREELGTEPRVYYLPAQSKEESAS